MEVQHYHYNCPLCAEEAIRERCPGFVIEWAWLSEPTGEGMKCPNMATVWFKDGTYMRVPPDEAHMWDNQPDWDYTEEAV